MGRMNCWEYNNCGRDRDKSCPAFNENAGRVCWLVAGTLCGGVVQGGAAQKLTSCRECAFYKKIKAKEI